MKRISLSKKTKKKRGRRRAPRREVSLEFAEAVRALPFSRREIAAWAGLAPHVLARIVRCGTFAATRQTVDKLFAFKLRIGFVGKLGLGFPKHFCLIRGDVDLRLEDDGIADSRREADRRWTEVWRPTPDEREFAAALATIRRLRPRVMGRKP